MSEALLAQALRSHQSGQLAEAARLYAAVLRAEPRHFQALYLLGFINFQQGQFEQAARLIGDAVKINPAAPDAFYNLGCALQNLQRHVEAVAAFDRALALHPNYAEAFVNRGVALLALARREDALASFDRALKLAPADAEALSNRAAALFGLKRYAEAADSYAKLSASAPGFPNALGDLALSRAYACDWRDHAALRTRIGADIAAGKPTISPHGSTLILADPQAQLLAAKRWVQDRCPPSQNPLWRGEIYPHDTLRIAYLSADFYAHATAFLIAGVFEHHDRTRFETTLVSFGTDDKSDMRERLKRGADRFVDVAGRSDADIARMLRQMEIDIAVDLKGFTDGSRPAIFAQRAAPVQVNYLAHPGTMGAGYMDYILADAVVIPPEHRGFYAERIVTLPDSYQANDAKRAIAAHAPTRAEAGLPEDGFVFCCFNNSYKITPAMFDVWMRLLQAVERSVLWLLDDNPGATANLKREAEARGLSASRIVFAPRMAFADHMARHRLADLFLDTLPCTAHTTASDALWVGLLVLTVLGTSFAGRVAASLLQAVGLPELITASLAEYEALALDLARNPDALAAMKAKLARNIPTAPLFDTQRFTRDLEAAFTIMGERYRAGQKPADFAVPAE